MVLIVVKCGLQNTISPLHQFHSLFFSHTRELPVIMVKWDYPRNFGRVTEQVLPIYTLHVVYPIDGISETS